MRFVSARRRSARALGVAVVGGLSAMALAEGCSSSSSLPTPIEDVNGDGGDGLIERKPDASTSVVSTAGDSGSDDGGIPCGDGGSLRMCVGQCVDTNTDPNNCGGCTQPCGTGLTCVGGKCQCGGLLTACGSQCVDTTTDQLNCGSCGHSCEDTSGSCVAGLCQATTVATANQGLTVTAIAIDSTDVFWTSPPTTANLTATVLAKAFSGGTSYVINMGTTIYPAGIAVDQNNVFWTDFGGAVWSQTNPDSTSAGSAVTYEWTSQSDPVETPLAIAADQNGSNIYWVDNTLNTVNQALKQGGSVFVLAQQRVNPHAIAVDQTATFVYWVDLGDKTGAQADGNVDVVPVGGGQVVALYTGEDQPEGIAVDSTNVYWTSGANPGSVKMLPIGAPAGTAPTVLASGLGSPHGVATDGQYVYWTNYDDNSVMKVSITGTGTPYTLAQGTECNNPDAIAVGVKNIFWANEGDGTIRKLAQ